MAFDFEFKQDHFDTLFPGNANNVAWYNALCSILPKYDITSKVRVASFLAQCGHESAHFTAIAENLNYRWDTLRKVFPKYFPTDALAHQYANHPDMIASRVYANRMGNGDEVSADGWKYRGRGLIQLTGYNNYANFAKSVGMTVADAIVYLGQFDGATESACWFWKNNNLNSFADIGDIFGATKKINGGTNGLEERTDLYNKAISIIGA